MFFVIPAKAEIQKIKTFFFEWSEAKSRSFFSPSSRQARTKKASSLRIKTALFHIPYSLILSCYPTRFAVFLCFRYGIFRASNSPTHDNHIRAEANRFLGSIVSLPQIIST